MRFAGDDGAQYFSCLRIKSTLTETVFRLFRAVRLFRVFREIHCPDFAGLKSIVNVTVGRKCPRAARNAHRFQVLAFAVFSDNLLNGPH